MRNLFVQLPTWVRWGVIPALALLVFGSLIMSVIGFLVGLLFKVLVFVALAALVVFLVKQFSAKT